MKKDSVIKICVIVAIVIVAILIVFVAVGIIKKYTEKRQNPIATIEVENYGTIKVELYPDQAPSTVANFVKLANNGYYDGTPFHRVIPGFMIQGGDKNGDGKGTPTLGDLDGTSNTKEYNIKGEMLANGYTKNKIKLEEGVIGMSRADYTSISTALAEESYNSAGSQFFIMHKTDNTISGIYAGFGKVIEGMDIVDKIANTPVTYRSAELSENSEIPKDENGNQLTADMPLDKPVIKSVRVETYGVDYGMPETVEPFNYYNYIMQYYGSSY